MHLARGQVYPRTWRLSNSNVYAVFNNYIASSFVTNFSACTSAAQKQGYSTVALSFYGRCFACNGCNFISLGKQTTDCDSLGAHDSAQVYVVGPPTQCLSLGLPENNVRDCRARNHFLEQHRPCSRVSARVNVVC